LKTQEIPYYLNSINKWHILTPLIVLITISILSQFTDFELLIENAFYINDTQRWLGESTWWLNTQTHDWERDLIVYVFIFSFSLFILSFFQNSRIKYNRRITAYLCLTIVLSTFTIGLGKIYSNVDCPRDLNLYGGTQPYIHVFSEKPDNLPEGHCFPGAHSSGAYSLYSLYFIFLIINPRASRKVLYFITSLGLFYGFTQWARGSHFISHDIWSGIIDWYICLGLFYIMFYRFNKHSYRLEFHKIDKKTR